MGGVAVRAQDLPRPARGFPRFLQIWQLWQVAGRDLGVHLPDLSPFILFSLRKKKQLQELPPDRNGTRFQPLTYGRLLRADLPAPARPATALKNRAFSPWPSAT
jgi:hypothetical protein